MRLNHQLHQSLGQAAWIAATTVAQAASHSTESFATHVAKACAPHTGSNPGCSATVDNTCTCTTKVCAVYARPIHPTNAQCWKAVQLDLMYVCNLRVGSKPEVWRLVTLHNAATATMSSTTRKCTQALLGALSKSPCCHIQPRSSTASLLVSRAAILQPTLGQSACSSPWPS